MTKLAKSIKVFVASTGPGGAELLKRRIEVRDTLQLASFDAVTNDSKEVSKILDAFAKASHLKCDWVLIVGVDSASSLLCRSIDGIRFNIHGATVDSIDDAIATMRERESQ